MEDKSHPDVVMFSPGENKAELYDFAEISGALYHAENEISTTLRIEEETERQTQSDSRNADALIRRESNSGQNVDIRKEEEVIVPRGENKAVYDLRERSRALAHAEKKVARKLFKTKQMKFKGKFMGPRTWLLTPWDV